MAYRFAPGCECCGPPFCQNGFGNLSMDDASLSVGIVNRALSPSSWSSSRVTNDPNFPESREVQITTATPGHQRHIVYHMLNGALHDPASDGAIVSISLSMAAIFVSGGNGLGDWGLVVLQGGNYYTSGEIGFINNAEQVTTKSSASAWLRNAAVTSAPNLTSGGAPMQFGFYLGSETFSEVSALQMRAARACITVNQ